MDERTRIVTLWTSGLSKPDEEHIAEVSKHLADDVTAVTQLGTTEGIQAVVANFGKSQLAPMLAQGTWTDPVEENGVYTVVCTFTGGMMRGLRVQVTLNDNDQISRVESTVMQAPPAPPVPVKLTDTIKDAVNGAVMAGTPVMVAYVDQAGRAHLSYRGSTQAYGDDQLAIWIRNPQGGLLAAIGNNPNLTLMYRAGRASYVFYGRARADDSESVREKVYTSSPEIEQRADPSRRGGAVIVDLDRVEGRDANGGVLMDRSAG